MQFGNADAIGIAWYKRADYQRIREIMADGETLPVTFDRWQSQAERLETRIQRSGKAVFRAYIDPEKFVAWCASRGLDVDAKARMEFSGNPANWAGKN